MPHLPSIPSVRKWLQEAYPRASNVKVTSVSKGEYLQKVNFSYEAYAVPGVAKVTAYLLPMYDHANNLSLGMSVVSRGADVPQLPFIVQVTNPSETDRTEKLRKLAEPLLGAWDFPSVFARQWLCMMIEYYLERSCAKESPRRNHLPHYTLEKGVLIIGSDHREPWSRGTHLFLSKGGKFIWGRHNDDTLVYTQRIECLLNGKGSDLAEISPDASYYFEKLKLCTPWPDVPEEPKTTVYQVKSLIDMQPIEPQVVHPSAQENVRALLSTGAFIEADEDVLKVLGMLLKPSSQNESALELALKINNYYKTKEGK